MDGGTENKRSDRIVSCRGLTCVVVVASELSARMKGVPMTDSGRLEIELQVGDDVSPLEVDQLTAAIRRDPPARCRGRRPRLGGTAATGREGSRPRRNRGVDREPRDRGDADPWAGGRGDPCLDRQRTSPHGEADSRRRQPGAWRHVRERPAQGHLGLDGATPAPGGALRSGHGGPTKRPDRRDEPVRGRPTVGARGTGARRGGPAGCPVDAEIGGFNVRLALTPGSIRSAAPSSRSSLTGVATTCSSSISPVTA